MLHSQISDKAIDKNLSQRQHLDLLPSELAWLLKTKRDSLAHQGKANESVGNTSENIGSICNLSPTNVRRYIRLTKLNNYFINAVDSKQIAFRACVELADLSNERQAEVANLIQKLNVKLSGSMAIEIKELDKKDKNGDQENKWSDDRVISILMPQKKEKKTDNYYHTIYSKIAKNIPKKDIENLEEIIIEFLKERYNVQ